MNSHVVLRLLAVAVLSTPTVAVASSWGDPCPEHHAVAAVSWGDPPVCLQPEPARDLAIPDADGWRFSVPLGGSRPVWWRPLPLSGNTPRHGVTRGGAGYASYPARPLLAPTFVPRGGNC